MEFMHSIEAIADAEAEVAPHVQPGGTWLIPGDEPLLIERAPSYPEGQRVVGFAAGPSLAVKITDARVGHVERGWEPQALPRVDLAMC